MRLIINHYTPYKTLVLPVNLPPGKPAIESEWPCGLGFPVTLAIQLNCCTNIRIDHIIIYTVKCEMIRYCCMYQSSSDLSVMVSFLGCWYTPLAISNFTPILRWLGQIVQLVQCVWPLKFNALRQKHNANEFVMHTVLIRITIICLDYSLYRNPRHYAISGDSKNRLWQ